MPRKTIPECTNAEIYALLIAGSIISTIIGVGSFWSSQPNWFLWPIRLLTLVWLTSVWYEAVRELRRRRHQPATPPRDERIVEGTIPTPPDAEVQ